MHIFVSILCYEYDIYSCSVYDYIYVYCIVIIVMYYIRVKIPILYSILYHKNEIQYYTSLNVFHKPEF